MSCREPSILLDKEAVEVNTELKQAKTDFPIGQVIKYLTREFIIADVHRGKNNILITIEPTEAVKEKYPTATSQEITYSLAQRHFTKIE